jgi:hypothetical protein
MAYDVLHINLLNANKFFKMQITVVATTEIGRSSEQF